MVVTTCKNGWNNKKRKSRENLSKTDGIDGEKTAPAENSAGAVEDGKES